MQRLQDLNPLCQVSVFEGDALASVVADDAQTIQRFSAIVICTFMPLSQQARINQFCRHSGVIFFSGSVAGNFGMFFSELGANFSFSRDATVDGVKKSVTSSANFSALSDILELPEDKWNAIIQLNLNAAFHTSKFVLNIMKNNKFGRIINIASAHGLVASEYKSAYVSAKHGVVGLTKVLALEGATFGITANCICPGYVKTPLVEKQIAEQAKSHGISEDEVISKIMLQKHPIKEFVRVESLGKLAVFLATDDADLITGASIPVDGGWTAQ